ncbi:class I SAM-dependent methyltransferase [Rhizobacter sp. P5_C2]
MSDSPSAGTSRHFDRAVVVQALRRLAGAPQAPWLHGEIARRMAERLSIVRKQPEAIADWWSFGGAGAEHLARAYPQARRIAIEPTPALRERSAELAKAPWWSPKRWSGAPVTVVSADQVEPGSVQLVWANMMLQAVFDPPVVLGQWQRALAVDGFAMFSCFGPDTLKELRALYRRLGWPVPAADFVDMHDLGDMLVQAGFADPVMDQELITLTWADPQALLAELRGLGGNAAPERFAGLRTPRWRARLLAGLQGLAGPDGRISMTFEVAYGHAFKAPPRVPLAAQTTVSLDDMRALVRARQGSR